MSLDVARVQCKTLRNWDKQDHMSHPPRKLFNKESEFSTLQECQSGHIPGGNKESMPHDVCPILSYSHVTFMYPLSCTS